MRELLVTVAGQQGAGKTTLIDLMRRLLHGRTNAQVLQRDSLGFAETVIVRIPNQADFVRDAKLRKEDTSAGLYRALKKLHRWGEEQRTRLGDDLPEAGPGREMFDEVTQALRQYEEATP